MEVTDKPGSTLICLSSSASLDLFPGNSPSRFVNKLPHPLSNPTQKKFYLRLRGVSVPNRLANFENWRHLRSGYLRVLIDEVEVQQLGSGYHRLAGGVVYPGKFSEFETQTFLTAKHAPFLQLQFQHLTQIGVTLANVYNEPVEFARGTPSLVWVELVTMDVEEQFTMTCTSYHPTTCPQNTLHDFINPLPSEVSVDGYEVALLQLVFPRSLIEQHYEADLVVNGDKHTWQLETFRTTDHFVDRVARDLRRDHELTFGLVPEWRDERNAGHPFILNSTEFPVLITLSERFAAACGTVRDVPEDAIRLEPDQHLIFGGEPSLYRVLPNPVAMLHCSLVQPNVMSGQQANLLQLVPVHNITSNTLVYEPSELSFQKVFDRPFNQIKFTFTNPDGSSREFLTPNTDDCILVTLVFRKIRVAGQS